MSESSTKPYFIRALHEWCSDNGYTPHVVVQVDNNTHVPHAFVNDGQITLNVGLLATNKLDLNNEFISFQARFGGKTEDVWVPISAVSAIFARETGAGMGFETEESNEEVSASGNAAGDVESAIPNAVPSHMSSDNVSSHDDHHASKHETDLFPNNDTPPKKRPRLSIVK